jgi:hypothetical protein
MTAYPESAARSQGGVRVNARDEFRAGFAVAGGRWPETPGGVPDFFEPGHTYRWTDIYTFECAAVAVHPETDERAAVGWMRTGAGPWVIHEYTDAHWSVHWTDVTKAGESL